MGKVDVEKFKNIWTKHISFMLDHGESNDIRTNPGEDHILEFYLCVFRFFNNEFLETTNSFIDNLHEEFVQKFTRIYALFIADIVKNAADTLPIAKRCLTRLHRQCSSDDASRWTDAAAAVDEALMRLITAGAPVFWATLVHVEDAREMLDSVADFYIRVNFFNESAIYLVDDRVKALYKKIYENNFFVYLRILSYESNQKFDSETDYADMLYGRRVMSVQRLVKLAAVYGRSNEKLCATLIADIFVVEPRFHNDLNDFLLTTEQWFFERAKSYLDELASSLENRRVALDTTHARCLLRILDNTINVARSLSAFMRVFAPPAERHNCALLRFLNNLPPLVDHVAHVLSDVFLALVARAAAAVDVGRFLGYLAHRRTLLLQSIVNLFLSFYNSDKLSERDRLMTLCDAVVCKEFLVRFDDAVGVRTEFLRFLRLGACDEDHMRTAERLLDDAYVQRARAIKVRLAQKRVLKNIGQPTTADMKNMLNSLTDLLPNYSAAQLHLCLKHYNYDVDCATNALMEPAEMPLDLRILMRAMDRFEDVNADTAIALPAFTDECRDDFDTDSLEKENDATAAASSESLQSRQPAAFSILPDPIAVKLAPRPAASDKPAVAGYVERSSKLEAIVSRFGDMFDLSDVAHIVESIDRAKENDIREVVVEDKVLVQPNLERRKLMADKPALTAKEESAIRLTYDRYKYEMSDDNDEGGRYNLEERYATSVGRTGRFNKPAAIPAAPTASKATASKPAVSLSTAPKATASMAKRLAAQPRFVDYEDEYDDTYDDPNLFSADDDEYEEDDDKTSTKNCAQSSSQADVKKRGQKDKTKKSAGRNAIAVFSSPAQPATKGGRSVESRQPQPPAERYLPSFAQPAVARERRPKNEPDDEIEEEVSQDELPANTNRSSQVSVTSKQHPQSDRRGPQGVPIVNQNSATSSSAAYTGGRARQNKERNKNKMKQRGVDRKMRGGMF